jgi:hypothetical protein
MLASNWTISKSYNPSVATDISNKYCITAYFQQPSGSESVAGDLLIFLLPSCVLPSKSHLHPFYYLFLPEKSTLFILMTSWYSSVYRIPLCPPTTIPVSFFGVVLRNLRVDVLRSLPSISYLT